MSMVLGSLLAFIPIIASILLFIMVVYALYLAIIALRIYISKNRM